MDSVTLDIFAENSRFQLSGIIGLALFFALVGIREARHERPEGSLFLVIAVFLTLAHAVLLDNLVSTGVAFASLTTWGWLVSFLTPALVALFLARGLFSFARYDNRDGMVKLFFGLTLACLVFMLGADWPLDVRAILTLTWVAVLFKVELAIAN